MVPAVNNGDGLKIRISRLSEGLHGYHFSSSPAELGLESNFNKTVEVKVTLDKTPRQIYLKSDIHTSGVFQCDRCLDEFEQPILSHFNMFYVYDEQDVERYSGDEVQVINLDTVSIDIAEDVRQLVALSVPLKLLCKEECKGLCPRCGVNWNHRSCTCNSEENDSRLKDSTGFIYK